MIFPGENLVPYGQIPSQSVKLDLINKMHRDRPTIIGKTTLGTYQPKMSCQQRLGFHQQTWDVNTEKSPPDVIGIVWICLDRLWDIDSQQYNM